jgi:acyl-CoA reductase-like NAD-dependent aldehyde dehydrogenase
MATTAWYAANFIGGELRPAVLGKVMSVIDPASEEVLSDVVPYSTAEDVDAAVDAAAGAVPTWKATSGAQRAVVLRAIAREVRAVKPEVCVAWLWNGSGGRGMTIVAWVP